ncbi:MAG: 4Fe-4S binding protein [Lentisphaerae bacterium]|nr:4Fe-4S binding protein [Lentisphaerota bacterium]
MSVASPNESTGTEGAPPVSGAPKRPRFDIDLYHAWCKACGLCEAYCPHDVYVCNDEGKPTVVQPEQCTGCQLCVLHCPDFAIRVLPHGHVEEKPAV